MSVSQPTGPKYDPIVASLMKEVAKHPDSKISCKYKDKQITWLVNDHVIKKKPSRFGALMHKIMMHSPKYRQAYKQAVNQFAEIANQNKIARAEKYAVDVKAHKELVKAAKELQALRKEVKARHKEIDATKQELLAKGARFETLKGTLERSVKKIQELETLIASKTAREKQAFQELKKLENQNSDSKQPFAADFENIGNLSVQDSFSKEDLKQLKELYKKYDSSATHIPFNHRNAKEICDSLVQILVEKMQYEPQTILSLRDRIHGLEQTSHEAEIELTKVRQDQKMMLSELREVGRKFSALNTQETAFKALTGVFPEVKDPLLEEKLTHLQDQYRDLKEEFLPNEPEVVEAAKVESPQVTRLNQEILSKGAQLAALQEKYEIANERVLKLSKNLDKSEVQTEYRQSAETLAPIVLEMTELLIEMGKDIRSLIDEKKPPVGSSTEKSNRATYEWVGENNPELEAVLYNYLNLDTKLSTATGQKPKDIPKDPKEVAKIIYDERYHNMPAVSSKDLPKLGKLTQAATPSSKISLADALEEVQSKEDQLAKLNTIRANILIVGSDLPRLREDYNESLKELSELQAQKAEAMFSPDKDNLANHGEITMKYESARMKYESARQDGVLIQRELYNKKTALRKYFQELISLQKPAEGSSFEELERFSYEWIGDDPKYAKILSNYLNERGQSNDQLDLKALAKEVYEEVTAPESSSDDDFEVDEPPPPASKGGKAEALLGRQSVGGAHLSPFEEADREANRLVQANSQLLYSSMDVVKGIKPEEMVPFVTSFVSHFARTAGIEFADIKSTKKGFSLFLKSPVEGSISLEENDRGEDVLLKLKLSKEIHFSNSGKKKIKIEGISLIPSNISIKGLSMLNGVETKLASLELGKEASTVELGVDMGSMVANGIVNTALGLKPVGLDDINSILDDVANAQFITA